MKTCCRCGLEKAFEEFNRYSRSPDGRQPHCRPCSSAYYQGNAKKHKENVAKRNRKIRNELRVAIKEYLATHPCVDCGETDPVVLEFDHVEPQGKIAAVSQLVSHAVGRELLFAEIEKCEVRCCNCHRRKTAKQFNWYSSL